MRDRRARQQQQDVRVARMFELYGKRYIRRGDRRVMLALLSGAGNLSGARVYLAAGIGSGSFYTVVDRLEQRGYVWRERREPRFGEEMASFRYRLTPAGRVALLELLGLEEYEPGGGWEPAPAWPGREAAG
jgi:DNA-binding MarR family transcriptional regulator